MNAHVPLNIAAVRVSKNDRTNIVSQFKGRTAVFERMPSGSAAKQASTGDMVVQPLESNASPADPLGIGIHLHWELPDYFRRGTQPAQGGDVVFPQAPNRWLVIRYIRVFDKDTGKYGDVQKKEWIVESDYVSTQLSTDRASQLRPSITVPLPSNPKPGDRPYMFMGRVVDIEDWKPAEENPGDFLPAYKGPNGKQLYLTSIGFVGPSFSAYYPECFSVFGFWDHFKDLPNVSGDIENNRSIQFKVSYQVVGWINEPNAEPLKDIASLVTTQYNRYVQECASENVPVTRTPADDFVSIVVQKFRWEFRKENITYTLKPDKTIDTLNVPERTLSAGIMQEIVWDMLTSPTTSFFLNNPDNKSAPAVWTDTVKLGAGNTTPEALSALLKNDIASSDHDLLDHYEYLLNTLQLGLLQDMSGQGNTLIGLEESSHSKAFSSLSGGYLWAVEQKQQPIIDPEDPDLVVELPLDVAEQLSLLNNAQKEYDQGRAALDLMRKQLFMDWLRFVKMYVSGEIDPFVTLTDLTNFVFTKGNCELKSVVDFGEECGILFYVQDPVTAEIIGLEPPLAALGETIPRAVAVWNEYQAMLTKLAKYPLWQLRATTAMPFWMPTDPVLVMEGARMEPARRNGPGPNTTVRVSAELFSSLQFKYKDNSFTVSSDDLSGLPKLPDFTPMKSDFDAEVGEAYLLVAMLASVVADALKAKGGSGNPAVENYNEFVVSLNSAQGGLSPLEGGTSDGLFEAVHTTGQQVGANPTETVQTPLALTATFTNDVANGWSPDAVAWNKQMALPEFSAKRFDPFLPVFLIWNVQLEPLKRDNGLDYGSQNLKKYFSLDVDGIDYTYSAGETFTTNKPVRYQSSITLSKATTYSLTNQIDNYVKNYSTDAQTTASFKDAKTAYENRRIVSQGLGSFNLEQTLRGLIPKVTVMDLVRGTRDTVTTEVSKAAIANANDNWYNFGFNGQAPIATGLLPQLNFGPLRTGFAEIFSLEIVDVFGQRMTLFTSTSNPDGSLQVNVAQSLKPAPGDTTNKDKIFLPPRLLSPARLWFAWLSAAHDNRVPDDFVEMNSHPATSPVFGWVMPNHLDDSLFFYDVDGTAIGTFGIEHGDLQYRTRAGNLNNKENSLEIDIGTKGSPTVNAHLADFMWYIDGRDAGFLRDLMDTIESSNKFITPAKFAQDASLAVLIGRPLALTRAVLGLETPGGLLPLSNADTSANDPFPLDVKAKRFKYSDRQVTSSAKLGGIEFPVRLGDLANVDDGLVGYVIESDPDQTFYSAAAPVEGGNGVKRPKPDTIQLTLSDKTLTVTMLSDPRAPVHATTGVLPVQAREIPPDQYADTVRDLAVTFFTHPMLSMKDQLIVPLPQEAAYQWSWITTGSLTPIELQPNQANEFATFGYTPQTLLEGWLRLATTKTEESEG